MKILIAEDDAVSRRLLSATLLTWGHEPVIAEDGDAAWAHFTGADPPALIILDWMMPGIDGAELCRRVRKDYFTRPAYIIMLTAQSKKEDIIAGLSAGADDYLTKPFDPGELRSRLQTGIRILRLQAALSARMAELETAIGSVRTLQGLLPVCSYCKKVRDDRNYWQQVDQYIVTHTDAQVSHGICPDCYAREIEPELKALREKKLG